MQRKQKIIFAVHLLLVVLILLFIFSHSLADRADSSSESMQVLAVLSDWLSAIGLNGMLTEHIVRKLAHFTEFAALGFFTAHAVRDMRPLRLSYVLHICFFGLLCAMTDESLQLLNDRSSQVTDVWLDFSGVVCGCLLFWLLGALRRVQRKRRVK